MKYIVWSAILPCRDFKYKTEKHMVSGPVWTWRAPLGTEGCREPVVTAARLRDHPFPSAAGHVGLGKGFANVPEGFHGFLGFGRLRSGGFWSQAGSQALEGGTSFRNNSGPGVWRARLLGSRGRASGSGGSAAARLRAPSAARPRLPCGAT